MKIIRSYQYQKDKENLVDNCQKKIYKIHDIFETGRVRQWVHFSYNENDNAIGRIMLQKYKENDSSYKQFLHWENPIDWYKVLKVQFAINKLKMIERTIFIPTRIRQPKCWLLSDPSGSLTPSMTIFLDSKATFAANWIFSPSTSTWEEIIGKSVFKSLAYVLN